MPIDRILRLSLARFSARWFRPASGLTCPAMNCRAWALRIKGWPFSVALPFGDGLVHFVGRHCPFVQSRSNQVMSCSQLAPADAAGHQLDALGFQTEADIAPLS